MTVEISARIATLTPIETSILRAALSDEEATAAVSLPAEVTRSLYDDLLRFGPNYENVMRAATDIYRIYKGTPEFYKRKRQNQLRDTIAPVCDNMSVYVPRGDIDLLIDRVVKVHWPLAHIWLELMANEGYVSGLDTDSNWYAMKLAPLASTFQLNSEDYRWCGAKAGWE